MKKKSCLVFISLVALLLALATGTARANDNVVTTVSIPDGEPVPIITHNGAVSGTIHVIYTTTSCALGPFATFRADMLAEEGQGQQHPSYPVTLNVEESSQGAENLLLSPNPSTFGVSGVGWTGSSTVAVSVQNCPTDPAKPAVGVLNFETNPKGAKLNTITTIVVKLFVGAPTACLRVYNFITEQESSTILDSAVVVGGKAPGKNGGDVVKSTNPGQFGDNVLVANVCAAPECFDVKINLDPNFELNPSSPGQAVFTYTTAGEIDPTTFDLSAFGAGTKQGTQLCLANVTLEGGYTFLATAHSQITKGIPVADLPSDSTFDFSATLYYGGSGCDGSLHADADPNPAETHLPFTVK